MSKCSFNKCPLNAVNTQNFCHLHTSLKEKDEHGFYTDVEKLIIISKNNRNDVYLNGVIFPAKDIDFKKLYGNTGLLLENRAVKLNKCIIENNLKINDINIPALSITQCKVNRIDIYKFKSIQLEIADIKADRIEIADADIKQIIFTSHLPATVYQSNIDKLLIVECRVNTLLVYRPPIKYVNIRSTYIDSRFHVTYLKAKNFLLCHCAFPSEAKIENVNSESFIISGCKWSKPELISIAQCNLTCSSFIGSDVSHVLFIDNQWRSNPTEPIKLLEHRHLIGEKKSEDIWGGYHLGTIGQCAETYRQLKRNFEEKGNYIDAGDFHYSEMEMRRFSELYGSDSREKKKITFWHRLSILSAYKMLSGYGECPGRAFLILMISLVIFSWMHLFAGFNLNGELIKYKLSLIPPFEFPSCREAVNAILLTFSNFTLRSLDWLRLSNGVVASILWTFETIFGPLQIGLLALAIKRKIHR